MMSIWEFFGQDVALFGQLHSPMLSWLGSVGLVALFLWHAGRLTAAISSVQGCYTRVWPTLTSLTASRKSLQSEWLTVPSLSDVNKPANQSVRAQGRTADAARELIEDALAIEKAGAFALLVEAVPPEVGRIITDRLSIPVLGIGAGMYTDGQLLIIGDMLGYFEAFTPKFVKKYANLAETIEKAMREFGEDVKRNKFPEEKHCYRMLDGEYEKLQALLRKTLPD